MTTIQCINCKVIFRVPEDAVRKEFDRAHVRNERPKAKCSRCNTLFYISTDIILESIEGIPDTLPPATQNSDTNIPSKDSSNGKCDASSTDDHSDVRSVRGGQNLLSDHLNIISPAQAEMWNIGSEIAITWNTQDIPSDVAIHISRNGGKTYSTIAETTPNNGMYTWTVTGPASANCMIKIEALSDLSKTTVQGLFTLSNPPDGDETPHNLGESGAPEDFTSSAETFFCFCHPIRQKQNLTSAPKSCIRAIIGVCLWIKLLWITNSSEIISILKKNLN